MTATNGITAVTSADELRSILGEPSDRVKTKERNYLTDVDKKWISASPFLLMSTSDVEGNCDVSPKGDPAGSLAITPDASTLIIPERPGNRRADGFHNILSNPHIGLVFFIPGRGDTLRVNGRATVVREAPYFDDLIVKGHRPILATQVEVQEVFFHCAKAFMRSGLWKPETWNPTAMPPHAQLVKAVQDIPQTLEELTEYYAHGYEKQLYEIR
ncbi:pyridoxamine 5'-phosphate oxidase family protein [Stackebrandtia endophytica]|nr:pyridoxamine 5'-phosphate oxidase family protein [Stackebrandtia endophytica]